MTDVTDNLCMLEKQGEDYIWRTAVAARKEIEQLRAALDELIACKDLLEASKISNPGLWREYLRRDPPAWAEARRLRGKE